MSWKVNQRLIEKLLVACPCFFPMVSNGAERIEIAAQCFPYQIDVNSHKRGQTAGVIYDDRVRVGECVGGRHAMRSMCLKCDICGAFVCDFLTPALLVIEKRLLDFLSLHENN